MTWIDLVVGLAIAVGLVSLIVPIFPGLLVVWVALLVWAVLESSATGWIAVGVASAVLAAGTVVKFTIPGGRLKQAGIPASTQWLGAVLGVVGFFVVPVVGLLIGFVLGVFVAEVRRLGPSAAGPSTAHALKAVGLSMVIEFLAGAIAALIWVAAVVAG
ncbi:DUF456 domain-containing protein [soil metagenome]